MGSEFTISEEHNQSLIVALKVMELESANDCSSYLLSYHIQDMEKWLQQGIPLVFSHIHSFSV